MIIPVNDKYRITSNPTCWQVEQYRGSKKDRGEYWEPLSYHVDFKSALVSLAELRIRLIDSCVPDEIIAAIKKIRDEVISSSEVFKKLVA